MRFLRVSVALCKTCRMPLFPLFFEYLFFQLIPRLNSTPTRFYYPVIKLATGSPPPDPEALEGLAWFYHAVVKPDPCQPPGSVGMPPVLSRRDKFQPPATPRTLRLSKGTLGFQKVDPPEWVP